MKRSTHLTAAAVHEAAHAVIAVLLGLRAQAHLHRKKEGCGVTDIDAPPGRDGDERLLVALVAGSVGEGRLLHQARQWHVSTEDAKAIVRLIGTIDDRSAKRLSAAKREASELVRDKQVWSAIEAVASQLAESGSVTDAMVREAVRAAGLRPSSRSSAAAGAGRR